MLNLVLPSGGVNVGIPFRCYGFEYLRCGESVLNVEPVRWILVTEILGIGVEILVGWWRYSSSERLSQSLEQALLKQPVSVRNPRVGIGFR